MTPVRPVNAFCPLRLLLPIRWIRRHRLSVQLSPSVETKELAFDSRPDPEEVCLKMLNFITSALVRTTRQLAGQFIWTHPNIAQTFRCRPTYLAAFKKTWLSLMWGGDPDQRQLRESIAVAVSAANQCFY